MINLRGTRIDQSFSLESGESQNFLVVELPDGTELRAPIDDAQTEQIIRATVNGENHGSNGGVAQSSFGGEINTAGLQPADPAVQTIGGQSDEQDAANAQSLFDNISDGEPEEPSEGELINWGALPNSMLTVTMKTAFKLLNASAQMTYDDITQFSNNIAETFGPEDWAKVQEQISPKPRAQKQQARPAIGQVAWADGTPMVAGGVPSRTVPMNDAGYPIVAGDVDPGEVVAGGDTDEDGVGQL